MDYSPEIEKNSSEYSIHVGPTNSLSSYCISLDNQEISMRRQKIENRLERLPHLGHLGLGCLQLETLPKDEAVNIIVEAYRSGVKVFDTAAAYGSDRQNEILLGEASETIKSIFGDSSFIFICTKCGINFATTHTASEGYEGSPKQIRDSVELSLKNLKLAQLPLLYLHRINPKASQTELIETFQTLKELVEEGKVLYLGLSEPTKAQIDFADEIFKSSKLAYNPFAFVQAACSVASQRALNNGVYNACQEKGIQFVSYTSVVRGLLDQRLTDAIKMHDLSQLSAQELIKKVQIALAIPDDDFRFVVGFFHESVIKQNLECILRFNAIAQKLGLSSTQLALAWQKANKMIPIPGMTSIDQIHSNFESMTVDLSITTRREIDFCFENFEGNPNPPKMLDNEALQLKEQ